MGKGADEDEEQFVRRRKTLQDYGAFYNFTNRFYEQTGLLMQNLPLGKQAEVFGFAGQNNETQQQVFDEEEPLQDSPGIQEVPEEQQVFPFEGRLDEILQEGAFDEGKEEESISEETFDLLTDQEKCERAYYGFVWTHPLEKCSKFNKNFTFEMFKLKRKKIGKVDVLIENVYRRHSKNREGFLYYSLIVQDADYNNSRITVWREDYDRFCSEFQMGNLVRLLINAPGAGFSSYTLNSPPKRERSSLPPKEFDTRVVNLVYKDDNKKLELDLIK